jgi:hypothetical protein
MNFAVEIRVSFSGPAVSVSVRRIRDGKASKAGMIDYYLLFRGKIRIIIRASRGKICPVSCREERLMGKKLLLGLVIACGFSSMLLAQGVTFTFDNFSITGTSPKYYEFDVMVHSTVDTTQFGDSMVYINYNTTGFGPNIASNGKVTVTKETLLQGQYWQPVPPPGHWVQYYTIINIADNTSSKLAITVEYDDDLVGPPWTNYVQTTPTKFLHIKIEIADDGATAGLSFDQSLMSVQQYKSYNTPATRYSPVTASDTDDSSLPVQMAALTATTSPEEGVVVSWRTESELNCLGFHVWRAVGDDADYTRITTDLIEGQGNTSTAHEYTFTDRDVEEGLIYYYKIEEVMINGERNYYGPIRVEGISTVPEEFALSPNYPNPFNPETHLKYQVPEASEVTIEVYSLLGKKVKTLLSGRKEAGYYTLKWNGTDAYESRVASGIYFVLMQSGTFKQVRRVTLMR